MGGCTQAWLSIPSFRTYSTVPVTLDPNASDFTLWNFAGAACANVTITGNCSSPVAYLADLDLYVAGKVDHPFDSLSPSDGSVDGFVNGSLVTSSSPVMVPLDSTSSYRFIASNAGESRCTMMIEFRAYTSKSPGDSQVALSLHC